MIVIRAMNIEDYDKVHKLWGDINGFGIRSVDDSRKGIARFLERNPGLSVVAEEDERIVGTILCGHDGRQGSFYHVCVAQSHRKQSVGQQMVGWCLKELKKEGISRVTLIAFHSNKIGNRFWRKIGWLYRSDVHYYQMDLNKKNITNFVEKGEE